MADDQTIIRIQDFIANNNGDFSMRCGSLSDNQEESDRRYVGEISGGNFLHEFDSSDLNEALDEIDSEIGRLGGV